jgi:hypothetical protein
VAGGGNNAPRIPVQNPTSASSGNSPKPRMLLSHIGVQRPEMGRTFDHEEHKRHGNVCRKKLAQQRLVHNQRYKRGLRTREKRTIESTTIESNGSGVLLDSLDCCSALGIGGRSAGGVMVSSRWVFAFSTSPVLPGRQREKLGRCRVLKEMRPGRDERRGFSGESSVSVRAESSRLKTRLVGGDGWRAEGAMARGEGDGSRLGCSGELSVVRHVRMLY